MGRNRQKFLVFCLLVSFLSVPASASDTEYVSRDTFWNWVAGSNDVIKQVINFAGGLGTCSKSEDTYHHASSYFKEGNVNGEVRYRCVCDLCGDSFTAYEKDLQQSYEAQVEELPAPSYNSDGSLYITLAHAGIRVTKSGSGLSKTGISCTHIRSDGYSGYQGVGHFSCENNSVYVVPKSGYSDFIFDYVRFFYRISAPIDGYYSLCPGPSLNGSTTIEGVSSNIIKSWTESNSSIFYDRGSEISNNASFDAPSYNSSASFVEFRSFAPTYKVTPLSSFVTEINTTYNITSRPTSITGDYGIIGNNGQIIKVEADKIVNETNNTIYNPATGQTHTMSDWSYNYEDRSYTVTTETGDTITITYGDENVTIKEGDTIYNVYYLVDGSGSENPGPGPDVPPTCDHTWAETSRTDPACSTPGKVTSTCSKCNRTKTETIPATGHSWVIDRTVQTTYDEEGNLLQQGYTIWIIFHRLSPYMRC